MEESHHHTPTNIITHDSPYPIYALAFSPPSSPTPHLALGSFLEHPSSNRVDILSFNPSSLSLSPLPSLSFPHPFPPSKLMFSPHNPSLLASSSDFLRLHSLLSPSPSSPISTLNNSHSSDFSSPLTSFDWNDSLPSRLATSSIDTTCTIWDLDTESVETQLIAHDKEVYDVAWGEARVFASVSGDGSVRVFDLRDKEHSTIIYEDPETPLLRLAWNKRDLRYMATVGMDSGKVVVLDIRAPTVPVAELERHVAGVNAVAWAPQSGRHVCSVGDDGQALVWEVPGGAGVGSAGVDPLSVFYAGEEINQVVWSGAVPDWIGIAFANKLQLLRV